MGLDDELYGMLHRAFPGETVDTVNFGMLRYLLIAIIDVLVERKRLNTESFPYSDVSDRQFENLSADRQSPYISPKDSIIKIIDYKQLGEKESSPELSPKAERKSYQPEQTIDVGFIIKPSDHSEILLPQNKNAELRPYQPEQTVDLGIIIKPSDHSGISQPLNENAITEPKENSSRFENKQNNQFEAIAAADRIVSEVMDDISIGSISKSREDEKLSPKSIKFTEELATYRSVSSVDSFSHQTRPTEDAITTRSSLQRSERSAKSELQQIEEQVSTLVEDIENVKVEVSDVKGIFDGAKSKYDEIYDEFTSLVERIGNFEKISSRNTDYDKKFDQIIAMIDNQQTRIEKLVKNAINMIENKANRKDLVDMQEYLKSQLNEIKSNDKRSIMKQSIVDRKPQAQKSQMKSRETVQNGNAVFQADRFCNRITNAPNGDCTCINPLSENHMLRNPQSTFGKRTVATLCYCSCSVHKGSDGFSYHSNCACKFTLAK